MIKIPGTFIPMPLLEKIHTPLLPIGEFLENFLFADLNLRLQQAHIQISAKRFLAMCIMNNLVAAFCIGLFVFIGIAKSGKESLNPFVAAIMVGVILFFFLLVQQRGYPEVIIKKRVDSLDRNILPAMQNILIQLRSGIPLFDVLVNVAAANYGEVSTEIMKVVKEINGGVHQIDALENPSPLYRSGIWQMVNGMKTGANLSDVLREIMNNLADEQILQVEQYGAVLSPMTMFYMILAVILPAIGVNFLIVVAAFMQLEQLLTQIIFWSVFAFTTMIQVVFLGAIKSKRPSLLRTD